MVLCKQWLQCLCQFILLCLRLCQILTQSGEVGLNLWLCSGWTNHYCCTAFQCIAEKTGEERFVGVGSFGPFTTAAQLVGVNEFMMYLSDEDEEDLVREVLEFSEEVVYHLTMDFLEAGGNLVYIAEPVSSGDLISEDYFETYSLPYLKQLNDRLSEKCPLRGNLRYFYKFASFL